MRYTITLEVESDSNPNEWVFEDRLVIDEPYTIKKVEKVK